MPAQSKFSAWFDAGTPPVHSGVFQRRHEKTGKRTYSYFDASASQWYTSSHSAKLALAQFELYRQPSLFQKKDFSWRGRSRKV